MMKTLCVREAFEILRERGIARDKQELRKWLNEGYIRAEPPVNRRVGWQIPEMELLAFIEKFEAGEFQELRRNRRADVSIGLLQDEGARRTSGREDVGGESGVAARAGASPRLDPYVIHLEVEVSSLRKDLRLLRRELNDLKKVLGFPVLIQSDEEETETEGARR
jgi:hypothetical protein